MSKTKKREEQPTGDAEQIHLTSEQQKLAELTDTLQRLQADFENYRKRVEKETAEFVKFANSSLLAKFLPVLDTLDVAIKNACKDNHDQRYVKGLELLRAQLLSVLQVEGLLPIECVGKKFDPHYHEVMLKEPSDKEEGTILEEFQKGYLLHNKIMRHSKVKISSPNENHQTHLPT
jgi:molecular chaperone GrpE